MLKKSAWLGPSNSLYLSLGEWPRLPFTARIERAHSDRARSASKKGTWPLPSLLAGFFSVLLCVLRRYRAYGRVPSLHLERGKGLWPQNRKKGLSFGTGEAGVATTVLPPRRLLNRRYSPIRRLRPLIRTRIREFLSPFHPSSFLWAAPR